MADKLGNMTPDQLSQTPAGAPPPGVQPNFIDPHSCAPVLIAVGTVLMALMFLFAGIRFYVKVFFRRQITSDDLTTLAAIVGTCWYYGICIHAVTRAKFGIHMWDISIAHTLSDDFLIASFFANWPTNLVWAFAKTSFFLMYLHTFNPLHWLRIGVYVGLIVSWGFYIAAMVAGIYYQAPNPGQSWQEGLKNPRYYKSFNTSLPIASGSLFLDIYIFVLPLIVVWNLQLTFHKKLGVMAVFATGLIACIASSLSIYFKYKLNHHTADYTYWVYPVLLMALVEMCVGISCNCMPSAASLFKNKSGKWTNWRPFNFHIIGRLFRFHKHGNVSGGSANSRENMKPHVIRKSNYINIKAEDSSTHELTTAQDRREAYLV